MPTIIDSLIVQLGLDSKDVDAKAPGVRSKLADLEKAGAKTEKGFKGIGKASKDTASELTVLSSKLTSFLAVIGGTVAVRAFVKDTIDTNTQLDFLSRNLDMSTEKLFAWGAAAQEIGGSKAGIQNFAKTIAEMPGQLLVGHTPQLLSLFARMGISFREPFDQIMTDLAKRFAGMDRKMAFSFGIASGIPEDVLNLLLQGPGAVKSAIGRGSAWGPTGKEAESAARLKREFVDLELQFVKIGYDLLYKITPYLEKFLGILQSIGAWAQSHQKIVTVIAAVAAALGSVAALATGIGAVSLAWTALTGALAAVWPVLAAVGAIAALGASILLLADDYSVWAKGGNSFFDWTGFEKNVRKVADAFDWLGDKISKATDAFGKWLYAHGIKHPSLGEAGEWAWNNATLPGLLGWKINPADERELNSKENLSDKDIETYFMNRGYSREWAAAMAANAMAESGGKVHPPPRDNEIAFGLFQWHDPDRQAAFKKQYGKDISQATATEQLDFAFLEMKNLGIKTGETVGPRYAASVVTHRFERPKDMVGESERRGNYAASLLNGVPNATALPSSVGSSTSSSTSNTDNSKTTYIDSITIHNPAGTGAVTPDMARGMDWTILCSQWNCGSM